MVKGDSKKKVVKKPATTNKKTTTKSKPKVKGTTKPEVKKQKTVKTSPVINETQNECKYCHKGFELGVTICPHCRKSQKDKTGPIIITVLSIVLVVCIICNHFIEKFYEEQVSESEYKFNCQLASYEELVRNPKILKNKDVKVIGKVLTVDGRDLSYGNSMTITMDINLFEGDTEQLVVFEYLDKNYSIGVLEGDIITVYGVYEEINGNIPFINAKYIVFGT